MESVMVESEKDCFEREKAQAAESTRVHISVIGNDVCTAQEPVVAPHVGVEADQTGSRSEFLQSLSNNRDTQVTSAGHRRRQ